MIEIEEILQDEIVSFRLGLSSEEIKEIPALDIQALMDLIKETSLLNTTPV